MSLDTISLLTRSHRNRRYSFTLFTPCGISRTSIRSASNSTRTSSFFWWILFTIRVLARSYLKTSEIEARLIRLYLRYGITSHRRPWESPTLIRITRNLHRCSLRSFHPYYLGSAYGPATSSSGSGHFVTCICKYVPWTIHTSRDLFLGS